MLNLIKDFIEFVKLKQQRRTSCERFIITHALIRYFEDLQETKGTVELPPYISAVNAVNELKTARQVHKMYRKLEIAGLV